MNMGRLMLLTFRITGHFSLFFARLSLRYLEKSWYFQPFWVWQGHPNFGGLDGLFSLYEVLWNIRPQLIWMLTTTPFATQPENFYLLCLSSDKSEMSRLEVWSGFFEVISVVFKGSTVNLFSELSTKAANRLLLFRYLHKNWTQQVFLYIAKIDIWEACQACF